jgi:hypothetical protein
MADKASTLRAGKPVMVKVRTVARTMTTATQVATLPRGSRILYFVLQGTASDAGTTATLSVGSTTTATEYVNALDVKTAATGSGAGLLRGVTAATGTAANAPTFADLPVYVKYAETGGASTVGSWVLMIHYTSGNDLNDDTI